MHTGKGDQRSKDKLFREAKDQVLFQWFCFSVERYERHQQQADNLNVFYCRFEKTNLPLMRKFIRLHCEKGPAEAVLPSPAEKVQPATGSADSVLLCRHWISPLHINICLVQLSYQIWPQKTTEGCPDCWVNHWYNPPHSPGTVLIQSEQKGCQNHSGPFTSSTLPLWTDTIWYTCCGSSVRSFSRVYTFLRKRTWAQLYRNSLTWS